MGPCQASPPGPPPATTAAAAVRPPRSQGSSGSTLCPQLKLTEPPWRSLLGGARSPNRPTSGPVSKPPYLTPATSAAHSGGASEPAHPRPCPPLIGRLARPSR